MSGKDACKEWGPALPLMTMLMACYFNIMQQLFANTVARMTVCCIMSSPNLRNCNSTPPPMPSKAMRQLQLHLPCTYLTAPV